MTAKQNVLLVGASGETGSSILKALVDDGGFDISLFVQPSSASKASTLALKEQGFPVVIGDLSGPPSDLVPLLAGYDTIISAIGPAVQKLQIPLITAAKAAGVKRFLPCGFTTVCPPGGIMVLRDDKEDVYNHILRTKIPYTIVDVGFWHQISYPWLPSGRSEYAQLMPIKDIYGDGKAKNLLTDERDVGKFVARIIKDERTVNRKVVTWSDELSQEELWKITEEESGEEIPRKYTSAEQLLEYLTNAKSAWETDKSNPMKAQMMFLFQYHNSKYIREDNCMENAKYLGYLDARDLYPDMKVIRFREFVKELISGEARRPYPDMKTG